MKAKRWGGGKVPKQNGVRAKRDRREGSVTVASEFAATTAQHDCASVRGPWMGQSSRFDVWLVVRIELSQLAAFCWRSTVVAAALLASLVACEPPITRESDSERPSPVTPTSSAALQEAPSAASASPLPGSVMAEREAVCVSRSGALRANGGVGELWLSREAAPAKRIVDGRTKVLYERGGAPLSEARIHGCSFSPDERSLYFLADKYGTSGGLYEVILDKGTFIFLGAANAFRVVNTCSDPALVGTLAIYRHDYEQPLKGYAFDWWVLIRPRTGAQIGAIGDSDENLDRFLAVRCGQGELPPEPPPKPSLPPLAQLRKACTDVRITLEQTPLLDGTTLEVIHLKRAGEGSIPVFAEDFPELLRQWECVRGFNRSLMQ